MTPHPYGSHAVLLHCEDLREAQAWRAAVAAAALPGVADVVAGARSVVVTGDPARTDAARLLAAVTALPAPTLRESVSGPATVQVELPVTYDGEDMDEVARLTGLSTAEVIALHAGAEYQVGFCGFSPGFAYLVGLPEALHLPRRETPRPRVPAGSVAIAAGYSAVYPQASPGGWWLLGRTDARVWDVDRDPPALLHPGDRVRFTQST